MATTGTATQIIPNFRIQAETHDSSFELEDREDAETVLGILRRTMGNHDWKLTEI